METSIFQIRCKFFYPLASNFISRDEQTEQFPDIPRKLQRHYDDWRKKIEPRVNEVSVIHIGSPQENPTMLTPCDWRDVFLDQQAQVRRKQRNGAWTLFVERDGKYEISLRRWPIEADLAITEAAPEYKGVDGIYAPGDALPIARADLKIAGIKKTKPISPNDKEVKFVLPLKSGATELQTWFRDASGRELCGAYYVYVNGPAKKKSVAP